MPVKIYPSSHDANALGEQHQPAKTAKDLLLGALPGVVPPDIDLYQSTWGHGVVNLDQPVLPSTNGFVKTLIHAYGQHLHLTLRPEDIWFAILTQFSLFVNAHGEELRHLFVAHEGQETIRLEYSPFSVHDFDFSTFVADISRVLKKIVIDNEFLDWLMPKFSTTTDNDRVVASIIMMGTLQKYFDYECGIICGFPSVTLLGEKSDYEAILDRIDKLGQYGAEPEQFAVVLRPVLRRFIRSFEDPKAEDVLRFWRTAFDLDDSLCGVTRYAGWITAFCFWSEDGNCLYASPHAASGEPTNSLFDDPDEQRIQAQKLAQEIRQLVLDDVRYYGIEEENLPPAWTKVPVRVEQSPDFVQAEMFAGSMGVGLSCSSNRTDNTKEQLNSAAPVIGWWITEGLESKMAALKKQEDDDYAQFLKDAYASDDEYDD